MLSFENQVSEQEMDEVIARSTYQESKESSSSPVLGTVIAHFHRTFRRVSHLVPPRGTAPCNIIGFSVITRFAEVAVKEIPSCPLAATFDFCGYLMCFIKVLIMHAS